MPEAVLLLALGWVGFAWAGYPLALAALARWSPRPVRKADVAPPVSIVLAVLNEEARLQAKLEDTLALDYAGPLEILVASDGSTDGTQAIARAFADQGVRLVALPERRGKEAAQAAAIAAARGEILVFSDVAARLEKGAVAALVRPFADARVACVSSEDVVDDRGGEGAYVRYEMALRRLESRTSTLVGLSGSFFAVRRELATPWPTDLASDFRVALETIRRGRRAVCEPGARARFGGARDLGGEWRRRVRTAQRGIAALAAYRDLLHPRHGRAALSVWGHKAARFTTCFALVVALGASLVAAPRSAPAAAAAGAQLVAYALAAAGLVWPRLRSVGLVRAASYFLLLNAAYLVAWQRHLRGERSVTWEPTRR